MNSMNDDVLSQARATLERAEGAARDSLETAAQAAEDGLETVHGFIVKHARERPMTTIGVAAGIGLLLGLLLSGRRD